MLRPSAAYDDDAGARTPGEEGRHLLWPAEGDAGSAPHDDVWSPRAPHDAAWPHAPSPNASPRSPAAPADDDGGGLPGDGGAYLHASQCPAPAQGVQCCQPRPGLAPGVSERTLGGGGQARRNRGRHLLRPHYA